jgi:hypothetical protein
MLRERDAKEMRDYVDIPDREELTLAVWTELIEEVQHQRGPSR